MDCSDLNSNKSGKMLATMGFGALAIMTMKAVLVSAMALMLSLIVAAKKLTAAKEDDGHHVIYAQEVDHHRRRRSGVAENAPANSPYRGYSDLYSDGTKRRDE